MSVSLLLQLACNLSEVDKGELCSELSVRLKRTSDIRTAASSFGT